MALLTVGLVGFLAGVVLAAGLLGPLGFGGVLRPSARAWRRRRSGSAGRSPPDGRLDLLIRGATVYPGDAPPFEGDVGVRGGTISL